MAARGAGIDLVEVKAFEKTVRGKFGKQFLGKNFTEKELAFAGDDVRELAKMFAGKEAVYKAFGTGWIKGRDVEVSSRDGKPEVILHGEIEKIAEKEKIGRVLLSLSSEDGHAVAVALLE